VAPKTRFKDTDIGVEHERSSTVDLNQATTGELRALPGIGPILAQRIVAHREEHGSFDSIEELTAVPGISRAIYERLADQLTIAPPDIEQVELEETPDVAPSEAPTSQDMMPLEVEEGILEEEAPTIEETPPVELLDTTEVPLEVPVLQKTELFEAKETVREKERVPPMEEIPTAEAPPAPRRAAPPPTPAPRRRFLGGGVLSWLGASLAGGVLGMIFTLLVLFRINGSLDLRNSHAILDMQNQVGNLAAETNSLKGEADGLRQRLDTLESLTVRMERAENTVDDLRQETMAIAQQVDALESELESTSEELSAMQTQTQQAATFFDRLQALLQEIFGDETAIESTPEMPVVTPTPTQ
jgi:competence ComEA-like helix-hairpin-helix protein